MYFNRAEAKFRARALLRSTHPKPAMVTFVYLLAVGLVSFLAQMIPLLPTLTNPYQLLRNPDLLAVNVSFLSLFITILVLLYSMVVGVGYLRYTLHVWREQPSGYGDLFSAFSMVGRVLAVTLLVALFTFLWSLLGILGLWVVLLVVIQTGSVALTVLCAVLGYIGVLIFVLNRVLRYAMAEYLLLDHPEMGALELLRESKRLMEGRLWSYFVLSLSFLGWYLLMVLVGYLIVLVGSYININIIPHTGVETIIGGVFLTYLLALLATYIPGMWISAYVAVTGAGFYDIISRREPPSAGAAYSPMDPTYPPAGPTYPPVGPTEPPTGMYPPTGPTQPPAGPAYPPTGPTEPTAEPTTPPAGSTGPGPLPTYIPPTLESYPPPAPQPAPEPIPQPIPEPESEPIPQPTSEPSPWPQATPWPETPQEEDHEPEL